MQKALTVLYVVDVDVLLRTVRGAVIIIRQVGDRYFPLLCSKIMKYLDYYKIIRNTAQLCISLSLALVQTNLLLLAINERVSVFVERLAKSDK